MAVCSAVRGAQICSLRLHCAPSHLPVPRISSSQVSAAREHSAQAGPQLVAWVGALAGRADAAGSAFAVAGSVGSALADAGALADVAGKGSRSRP